MRIALVAPIFVAKDGVGRSTAAKVRMLTERGHRVQVYLERPDLFDWPELSHHVRIVGLRDVLAEAIEQRAGGFLDHDVFLYEYPGHYELLESCRLLGSRPIVFDCHGLTPARYFDAHHEREFVLKGLENLPLLALARRVIVHSEFIRAETARQAGIPADAIEVVPLSLDSPYGIQATDLERSLGRARFDLDQKLVILYVGRIAAHKGLATLVGAMAQVVRKWPAARLVLCGDDRSHSYRSTRAQLERQAARLGIAQTVRFLGQIAEEELPSLYAAADLVVAPSEHEGFCLPVAEAMGRGRAVVAADCAALPETAGGAALLFEHGNAEACAEAILRVAGDSRLRSQLVERGLDNARRFEPSAVGAKLESIFAEAIRQSPGPPAHPGAPVGRETLPLLSVAARLKIDYVDRSRWPVIGRLASAIRSRLTLHLEKYFVREMQKNLGLFMRLATSEIEFLHRRIDRLTAQLGATEGPDASRTEWSRLRRASQTLNQNHHARMTALHEVTVSQGTVETALEEDIASYSRLLERLPRRRFESCLELGSGGGRDFRLLTAVADRVFGVELYAPAIGRNGGVVNGMLEELPCRSGAFDLVVSRHVMEHVIDPGVALAEVRRVLRPGGVVAAITPHYFPDPEPAHRTQLTSDQWRREYEAQSFRVLSVELHDRPVPECHLVAELTATAGC